jgi:hypothetical protein
MLVETGRHLDGGGGAQRVRHRIFGAIVPLNGPGGLPALPPSQIESLALAGAGFPVNLAVADGSVSLSMSLTPGDHGVSSAWMPLERPEGPT